MSVCALGRREIVITPLPEGGVPVEFGRDGELPRCLGKASSLFLIWILPGGKLPEAPVGPTSRSRSLIWGFDKITGVVIRGGLCAELASHSSPDPNWCPPLPRFRPPRPRLPPLPPTEDRGASHNVLSPMTVNPSLYWTVLPARPKLSYFFFFTDFRLRVGQRQRWTGGSGASRDRVCVSPWQQENGDRQKLQNVENTKQFLSAVVGSLDQLISSERWSCYWAVRSESAVFEFVSWRK